MQSTSQPQKCPVIHKYHLEYELCLNVFSGHCTSYQLFTIYNSSHVKVRFGRSHTKAWTWRFQRVKLQGRWSVVLLHSPTLIQQSAATTQLLNVPVNTHKGILAYKPSHVTVLSGERWANMADVRRTVCFRRQAFLNMRNICWLFIKKMALFSIQRPFLPTDWQYIWKRKANAYHTSLSRSTDTFFFFGQIQDPGMHYIAYFASVILIYLPQHSVQKKSFLRSILYTGFKQELCSVRFFSAVYILTSVQVRLTQSQAAFHTSWKNEALSIQPHNVRKELTYSLCALQNETSGTIYKKRDH